MSSPVKGITALGDIAKVFTGFRDRRRLKIMPPAPPQTKIKIFNTVEENTGQNVHDLWRIITEKNVHIEEWARDYLAKVEIFTGRINLARLRSLDLGCRKGASWEEIYHNAQSFGLTTFPLGSILRFRCKYGNQPNGDWFLVGAKPIVDENGNGRIFRLGHAGGHLWISTDQKKNPESIYPKDAKWVFRIP